VPYQVVSPRWSFSYPGADFSHAAVALTRNGLPVPVAMETPQPGYGENALVWVPDKLNANVYSAPVAPVADTRTDVTIENVLIGGTPRSFSYSVTVFDLDVAPGVVLSFAPNAATLPYFGATGTSALRLSSESATWTVESDSAWLHITSPVSGRGDAVVTVAADLNPNAAPRTATLTSSAARLSITQAGTPCTYTFQPSAGWLPAGGGQNTTLLTLVPPDCSSVYSLSPGLSVTPSREGGTLSLVYSAGANTAATQRQLTISIGGQTFRHRSRGPACCIREHAEQLRNLSEPLPMGSRKEWKKTIRIGWSGGPTWCTHSAVCRAISP
jgi:hypothetical protein